MEPKTILDTDILSALMRRTPVVLNRARNYSADYSKINAVLDYALRNPTWLEGKECDHADCIILDGRTDRGRRLRLVFQDKGNGLARVFTGWDLKRKKRRKR